MTISGRPYGLSLASSRGKLWSDSRENVFKAHFPTHVHAHLPGFHGMMASTNFLAWHQMFILMPMQGDGIQTPRGEGPEHLGIVIWYIFSLWGPFCVKFDQKTTPLYVLFTSYAAERYALRYRWYAREICNVMQQILCYVMQLSALRAASSGGSLLW